MERKSDTLAGTADLKQLSNEDLAVRFQLGCEEAFTVLCERLRPRLVSFLHHRLGNVEDAEDVAQNSFARAWQQRAQFDPRFQFTTWLYVIAKRRATDHQRRRKHVVASQIEVDLEVAAISTSANQSTVAQEGNVWSIAYGCLSVDQYSATWLRYGEGLSVKEIATILGKSTVSVRVHLHRARAVLKRRMEDGASRQAQISDLALQSNSGSNPEEAER